MKYSSTTTVYLNLLSTPSKPGCQQPIYWRRHSLSLLPGMDDHVEVVVVADSYEGTMPFEKWRSPSWWNTRASRMFCRVSQLKLKQWPWAIYPMPNRFSLRYTSESCRRPARLALLLMLAAAARLLLLMPAALAVTMMIILKSCSKVSVRLWRTCQSL